jgi:uncharacterized integral membrane protein (TIGR00697 family)
MGVEQQGPVAVEASALRGQPMRYFDFVMAAFVTILLLSNVLGAGKRAVIDLPGIGLWPFGAGILFFPVSYVLGDVLTEVYGYARARRCIWTGFAAMLFMVVMSWVVVALPPDQGWTGQAAYESVFGQVPRIVLASICAFWAGEFANSLVLSKMKLWTRGKHLWTGGRQLDILSAGLLRGAGLAGGGHAHGHGQPVHPQSLLGSAFDAGYVWRGGISQAPRGNRRV